MGYVKRKKERKKGEKKDREREPQQIYVGPADDSV
jgi:hypothetical protein